MTGQDDSLFTLMQEYSLLSTNLIKKAESFQHMIHSGDKIFFVAPDNSVLDQMLLKLWIAALLQSGDTIGPVVLQVGHLRFHRVGGALPIQARQREVVVQRQNLGNVVKALDVLVGFRVVCTAVHVLQHVHVMRDPCFPHVRVLHIIPKVDITEIVARSTVIPDR